jgi:hypothetical protein
MTELRASLKLCVLALAAVLLLALPAAASAKRHHERTRDRNHDGLPDKWERHHHLSTKARGVGKADPDRDGLNNRGEFRSRTNPRRADSDGDGVGDANEDADRDGVDNGNECRERTNPRRRDSDGDGVRDGAEDADRDRLNNGGEDEAEDDPINPDTDGDGIKDGDERAGEITAWDGTTLTIRVFGGSTISGVVDDGTWIDCGDDSADDGAGDEDDADDEPDPTDGNGWEWKVRFRNGGDDDSADDDSADDEDDDAGDVDSGDEDSADDDGSGDDSGDDNASDEEDAGCAADVLKVGAVVREASFQVTGDGTFFDSIEIAAP